MMPGLYTNFLEAGNLIANAIGLKNSTKENRKRATPNIGVDYSSNFINESGNFDISLSTSGKGSNYENWETLELSIYFYNNFNLCQFYAANEAFKDRNNFDLKQWATEKAELYLIKKSNNDLGFLFGDRDIRVRGIPGVTNSTLIEFVIILKGYIAWGACRLLVYRFHHGKGDDEMFSYAFFIESRHFIYDYSYWCLFPTFVGMSGGTGHGGYIQAEALLKEAEKSLKVTVIDVTVAEEKLFTFLRKKNVAFKTYNEVLTDDLSEFFKVNAQAEQLIEKLSKCSAGKQDWREYQNIMGEVFTYLFSPPLNSPKIQSRTLDGLEIRDLILPNHATQGFWNEVRTDYKGAYIVVEAKNTSKPDQKDVLQIADYLNANHAGLFGIMVSRKLSKSALEKRRKFYSESEHKMIVLLDDNDIVRMIQMKSNKEKPEEVIREKIDSYRTQFQF
jgi:hypothetical protein